MEITSAQQGYLAVHDPLDGDEAEWSMARSLSPAEIDEVRAKISRGILAEALATGETVVTDSAMLDERFSAHASVQSANIGAVICAPIGDSAARGAVYRQRRARDGAFSDEDRDGVELFARHLAPLADRLLTRSRAERAADPTRELRRRFALDGIVGRSPALAEALEQAMLAAPLDVTVLLTGESGTGKSQLARAIHDNSARARGPFVDLNCAALPETLLESELFGSRAGAHSTATQDTPGKVAAAEGGTLLLDEIGELPLAAQAKLLHLLQSRDYFPLGSSRPVRADIRIIAATNADLEARVADKRFREDLYFRLHVLPIAMPPLAARRDDLRDLAHAVADRVVAENRLPELELAPSALRSIEVAEWPGNVRQLESVIAAAAIRAAGERSPTITERHLFPRRSEGASGAGPDPEAPALGFQEATRQFQRSLLARTLEETDWNVSEAARQLDLARSHVYKLIEAFGFERGSR
jgi:Nif-specific regulatory protein